MLDRELKKGSAELIILSIVEPRPRHGYEISKLIETQSGGQLKFHVASLYPLLYRLEERGWLQGRWVEKAGRAAAPVLRPHRRRTPRARAGSAKRGRRSCRPCSSSRESTMPDWAEHLRDAARRRCDCQARARRRSSRSCRSISTSATRSCGAPARHDADASRLALEELGDPDALPHHMGALRQAHVAPPITPGAPGVTAPRRSASGPPARGASAAQAARVHGGGDADARARHRRQHRHLQPDRRGAPAPAAVPGRRPSRRDLGGEPSGARARRAVIAARQRRRCRLARAHGQLRERGGRVAAHRGLPGDGDAERVGAAASPPASSKRWVSHRSWGAH